MPAGITTLLEAMAMGKAIVLTETAALRGVIEHGYSGLTVPPGDYASLREAVEELLETPSLRTSLGERARRWPRSATTSTCTQRLWRKGSRGLQRELDSHPGLLYCNGSGWESGSWRARIRGDIVVHFLRFADPNSLSVWEGAEEQAWSTHRMPQGCPTTEYQRRVRHRAPRLT